MLNSHSLFSAYNTSHILAPWKRMWVVAGMVSGRVHHQKGQQVACGWDTICVGEVDFYANTLLPGNASRTVKLSWVTPLRQA